MLSAFLFLNLTESICFLKIASANEDVEDSEITPLPNLVTSAIAKIAEKFVGRYFNEFFNNLLQCVISVWMCLWLINYPWSVKNHA